MGDNKVAKNRYKPTVPIVEYNTHINPNTYTNKKSVKPKIIK